MTVTILIKDTTDGTVCISVSCEPPIVIDSNAQQASLAAKCAERMVLAITSFTRDQCVERDRRIALEKATKVEEGADIVITPL